MHMAQINFANKKINNKWSHTVDDPLGSRTGDAIVFRC